MIYKDKEDHWAEANKKDRWYPEVKEIPYEWRNNITGRRRQENFMGEFEEGVPADK
jgi:hypothetical protein